jgi:hypothetical protein
MDVIEGLTVLLSWPVLASSISIYATIAILKRIALILKKELDDSKLMKIFLTLAGPGLGCGIAFHPGFLPGNNLYERMIAGIVAGFLSNYFYHFIRRFFKEKSID